MSSKNSFRLKIPGIANNILLIIVSAITFIPFYLVAMTSVTSERSISANGYQLFPEEFSFEAYGVLFGKGSSVLDAYKVTIFVTLVGTFLAVAVTSMMAYAISRKSLKYRNAIGLFAYFPMVFYGGLVPFYMILIKLGFKDNLWGLIIPMLVNPFNLFLILNYFRTLPDALIESAKMDGAGELRTFLQIILPMSGPGIATITLFYMLAYWNEWVLGLLLIENRKLYPLQYLLRQVMSRVLFAQNSTVNIGEIPAESTKMATCLVTIGPIIFVYPFIQKYFIKGITIGAVKG